MKTDQPFAFKNYLDKVKEYSLLFDPLLTVLNQIENFALNPNPYGCLLGIKGKWGVGKTSLLWAIYEYFKNGRGWPVIFFEAWKYQNDDQPIIPLLIKLQEFIQSDSKLRNILKSIANIALNASDMLGQILTKTYFGKEISIKEIFNEFSELKIEKISEYENIFSRLKNLVEEIVRNHKPKPKSPWKEFVNEYSPFKNKIKPCLLIIVDDLDRLLPDRSVLLLESIRFYLMLPYTIVILGINDEILKSAIEIKYCSPFKDEPYFSGLEFMEKLFHWNFEIPPISYNPYMDDIHFSDVKEFLNNKLPSRMNELLSQIDPLSHRKWNRIANRWETYLRTRNINDERDQLECLLYSILFECFPKIELLLRDFPSLRDDFFNQVYNPTDKHLIDKIVEKAKNDTTFLKEPNKNFNNLTSFWKEISSQISGVSL